MALLEDIKITAPSEGEKTDTRCGRRKAAIPFIFLAAVLLMGAGFAIIYMTSTQRGGSGISSKRSVSIQLSDEEFVLRDADGDTTDEFAPGTLVDVAPKIENTGDISAFVFLRMEVPYGTADDGTVVEFVQYQPSSAWTELDDCKEITDDYIYHIYAYETSRDNLVLLDAGGSTTEPLFNGVVGGESDIIVGNIGLLSDEERTKEAGLYFQAYGIQSSIKAEGLTDSQIWEKVGGGH